MKTSTKKNSLRLAALMGAMAIIPDALATVFKVEGLVNDNGGYFEESPNVFKLYDAGTPFSIAWNFDASNPANVQTNNYTYGALHIISGGSVTTTIGSGVDFRSVSYTTNNVFLGVTNNAFGPDSVSIWSNGNNPPEYLTLVKNSWWGSNSSLSTILSILGNTDVSPAAGFIPDIYDTNWNTGSNRGVLVGGVAQRTTVDGGTPTNNVPDSTPTAGLLGAGLLGLAALARRVKKLFGAETPSVV